MSLSVCRLINKTRHTVCVASRHPQFTCTPSPTPPSSSSPILLRINILFSSLSPQQNSHQIQFPELMAQPGSAAIVLILILSLTVVNGLGGKVGGRTKIKDVKTNQEVQELGRFSVEQYNLGQRQRRSKGGSRGLKFTEVVEAEKQVVSGIKYYLKVMAATSSGVPKTFDAVVVVRALEHSKELLNFAPSSAPTK
ncbi:hypothetical protein LguiB_013246 [Lonicera macranthoides]